MHNAKKRKLLNCRECKEDTRGWSEWLIKVVTWRIEIDSWIPQLSTNACCKAVKLCPSLVNGCRISRFQAVFVACWNWNDRTQSVPSANTAGMLALCCDMAPSFYRLILLLHVPVLRITHEWWYIYFQQSSRKPRRLLYNYDVVKYFRNILFVTVLRWMIWTHSRLSFDHAVLVSPASSLEHTRLDSCYLFFSKLNLAFKCNSMAWYLVTCACCCCCLCLGFVVKQHITCYFVIHTTSKKDWSRIDLSENSRPWQPI